MTFTGKRTAQVILMDQNLSWDTSQCTKMVEESHSSARDSCKKGIRKGMD